MSEKSFQTLDDLIQSIDVGSVHYVVKRSNSLSGYDIYVIKKGSDKEVSRFRNSSLFSTIIYHNFEDIEKKVMAFDVSDTLDEYLFYISLPLEGQLLEAIEGLRNRSSKMYFVLANESATDKCAKQMFNSELSVMNIKHQLDRFYKD